jgi:hypothetical protein
VRENAESIAFYDASASEEGTVLLGVDVKVIVTPSCVFH